MLVPLNLPLPSFYCQSFATHLLFDRASGPFDPCDRCFEDKPCICSLPGASRCSVDVVCGPPGSGPMHIAPCTSWSVCAILRIRNREMQLVGHCGASSAVCQCRRIARSGLIPNCPVTYARTDRDLLFSLQEHWSWRVVNCRITGWTA